MNVKETLSLSSNVRKPLHTTLVDVSQSNAVPVVPEQPLKPLTVKEGFLLETPPLPDIRPTCTSLPMPPPSTVASLAPQTAGNFAPSESLSRKCVIANIMNSRPTKKPRKRCTCVKCANVDCPGSQKVSNCRNPCQDCKKTDCRGRNSKRPDKPCSHAWE